MRGALDGSQAVLSGGRALPSRGCEEEEEEEGPAVGGRRRMRRGGASVLGDDVSGAVAHLDGDDGHGATDAEHREDVHDGVRAPREHGRPADLGEHRGDGRVRLGRDRAAEADEERVDDVHEGDHGEGPPHPADAEVALDDQLAGVAEDDHEARGDAELGRLRRCLLGRELHDEDDLDEEERHGEQPVHVAVGVVERHARDRRVEYRAVGRRRPLVRLDPRVEDANVVVRSDERDEATASVRICICEQAM